MFREIFGGLMGGKKGETSPRKGDWNDPEARLKASLGTPNTSGSGFDRGGWGPTVVSTPKTEQLPWQASQEAPQASASVHDQYPSDPFSAEPAEHGTWSGIGKSGSPAQEDGSDNDIPAAAK